VNDYFVFTFKCIQLACVNYPFFKAENNIGKLLRIAGKLVNNYFEAVRSSTKVSRVIS
jgi:hypothetical protein